MAVSIKRAKKNSNSSKKIIEYTGNCKVRDELKGKQPVIAEIAPLRLAGAADLAFGKSLEQIINSKSVIILCPLELDTPIEEKVLICVDNQRLWFIHIMKKFFHIPRPRIRISKNVYRKEE